MEFEVTQKRHKIKGDHCDGVATFKKYGIVYDCKNTANFIPIAENKRLFKKYLRDERSTHKKALYGAFIAKSFGEEQRGDIFYFSIESLLYLLYKKLIMGSKFTLSPFRKIF